MFKNQKWDRSVMFNRRSAKRKKRDQLANERTSRGKRNTGKRSRDFREENASTSQDSNNAPVGGNESNFSVMPMENR